MSDDVGGEPHLRHLARSAGAGDGDEALRTVAVGRVGTRPQLSVRFVAADGTEEAFSYAHLHHLRLAGGARVELEFYAHAVVVEGRGLGRLFKYLCDHRAAAVREADGGADRDFGADGDERVNSITVRRLGGPEPDGEVVSVR